MYVEHRQLLSTRQEELLEELKVLMDQGFEQAKAEWGGWLPRFNHHHLRRTAVQHQTQRHPYAIRFKNYATSCGKSLCQNKNSKNGVYHRGDAAPRA